MSLRRIVAFIALLIFLFTAGCGTGQTGKPTPPPTRPPRTTPTRAASSTPPATATERATEPPSPTPLPPTATASPTPTVSVPAFGGPFQRGDRSPDPNGPIFQIQNWLTALGYTEVGEVDGIFGGMTETAVKHFQQDHDLPATGVVDEATWTALYRAFMQAAGAATATPAATNANTVFERSLQLGDWGDDVKQLHTRLKQLGYPLCQTSTGREFNDQTAGAVRLFQRLNGLTADGVVGPMTAAVMFSEDAVPFTIPDPTFTASVLGKVAGGEDLAYAQNALWLARETSVDKIAPASGEVLKTIAIPDLPLNYNDESGNPQPIGMKALAVQPLGNTLWVGGGARFKYGLLAPVMRPFALSGQPKGEPVYFYNPAGALQSLSYVEGYVGDLAPGDGNSLWAAVHQYDSGVEHLYRLSAGGEIQAHFSPNLLDTALGQIDDLVVAGDQLWAVISDMMGGGFRTLKPISPAYGVAGESPGVCGTALAYDGKWLWVGYTDGVLLALNPATGEVEASARIEGQAVRMTSNGKGRVWIVATGDRKHYTLQFLSTR